MMASQKGLYYMELVSFIYIYIYIYLYIYIYIYIRALTSKTYEAFIVLSGI
jgi:hypothetical protein